MQVAATQLHDSMDAAKPNTIVNRQQGLFIKWELQKVEWKLRKGAVERWVK